MIKGGYKIIDFKGAELSNTAVEITGIYNQIVDDYNKPIMVSGVSISGELQDDAYASVKVSDDSVALTVYDGVITVTDDDEVSFTLVKSNAELAEDISNLIVTSRIVAESTGNISVGATTTVQNFDITSGVPTGYKVIGCYCNGGGDDGFLVSSIELSDDNTKLSYVVRNVGNEVHSGRPRFILICVKE